MELFPLVSRLIKPKDDLFTPLLAALKKHRKKLQNGDILTVTSKVVSLSENRVVSTTSTLSKAKIVQKEADQLFGGKNCTLTLKNGILIPEAGVDASNAGKSRLILWPRDSWRFAAIFREKLIREFKLRQFGVIVTDSTCRPLRWGVSGIALAWAGFEGVADCRGEKDLFGEKLRVTRRALADALAAAAGVISGEAAESIPFVLIRGAEVRFTTKTVRPRRIKPKDCLFAPIYAERFRK